MIRQAKALGYKIHLLFIALDSPERCITRVKNRAAQGGHFIPEEDVKRRYARSMERAAEALPLTDVATFFDNTGDDARIVMIANEGQVVWRAEPLPKWLRL